MGRGSEREAVFGIRGDGGGGGLLKILSITAGAARMYCGSCLRDNSLAAALKKQGHDVVLLPMYTPTRTDEPNVSEERLFFGGISVYLKQRYPVFRRMPRFVERLWDSRAVISAFAGRGIAVDPGHLGALTVSTLEGVNGHHRSEVEKLVEWLRHEPVPDVVTLPYTLLISLAKPLHEATGRPVVCTLQGEEIFLGGLPEPYRTRAIELIRAQIREVDAFLAVSAYGARHMAGFLGIAPERIHTVPLGVNLDGHGHRMSAAPGPYRIGFLTRVAPEKGIHLLIEAYKRLRETGVLPESRLEVAGYMAPEHRGYVESLREKMRGWGLGGEFIYGGELDRAGKLRMLQRLDVMAIPAVYDEPKGLSVLEAMASGVPVVVPRRGSFPEMVEQTGGGLLIEPDSVEALEEALRRVYEDRELARRLGMAGYRAVHAGWSVERMAERTAEVYRSVCGGDLGGRR